MNYAIGSGQTLLHDLFLNQLLSIFYSIFAPIFNNPFVRDFLGMDWEEVINGGAAMHSSDMYSIVNSTFNPNSEWDAHIYHSMTHSENEDRYNWVVKNQKLFK